MPRLLSTLPMEKDGIFYGIFLIYIKISFYSNVLQYSSIPALAPKQNERVTIQIHTRLPFKISPFTLVVAIANANRRGFFFFPPSFLSHLHPPRSPCGQDGMFSSILCGLEALTSRGELEGLAVHPEDTPEAYRSLPVDLLSLDSGRNLPT